MTTCSAASNERDPYRELQRMQDEMSRLFNDALLDSLSKSPSLDLKEIAKDYVTTMDIPGGDPSSLATVLKGNQLTVTMKSEHSKEDDGQNYRSRERFSGAFTRSVTLPVPIIYSIL
jgi:HSP20 family protein